MGFNERENAKGEKNRLNKKTNLIFLFRKKALSGGAGLSMEEGVGAGVVNGKKKAQHRGVCERDW